MQNSLRTYQLNSNDEDLSKSVGYGEKKDYYVLSRTEVQRLVNPRAKIILDVGCAEGQMASELKEKNKAEVWGIECVEKIAKKAAKKLDKVLIGRVEEQIKNLPDNYFETIVFADVLEHLVNPENILREIKRKLKINGEIIISIPNVRHWTVIASLLDGSFDYADFGILDKNHLRFFTLNTAIALIKKTGYEIINVEASIFGKFELPKSLLTEINKMGLNVESLQERSKHYQYLFKAQRKIEIPKVSIIIPVYNKLDYTLQTINSIYEFTNQDFELIIIDNASDEITKAGLEKIASSLQNIIIIRNNINFGFPSAINQGLRQARGKYIVIANNDIVLSEGWLKKMIDQAEKDESIGIVGAISNQLSDFKNIKDADYKSLDYFHKFAEKFSQGNSGESFEFPIVGFFCTLIKKKVLDSIGGLDENFSPGYYEDNDFCLRAQLSGFKTIIAQDVFIHHFGSVSFKSEGSEKYSAIVEASFKKFANKWGATPNQIWLKGKKLREDFKLIYSITKDSMDYLFGKAVEMIENDNYKYAKEYLIECKAILHNNSDVNIIEEKIEQMLQKIEQINDGNEKTESVF